MKRFILITLVSLSLLLAACASTAQESASDRAAPGTGQAAPEAVGKVIKTDKGQYTDISVKELETMLKQKDFVFVNVHIPFEGNLPQTDVSIPFDQIDQHLDQLPSDKKAKIVLYCRSDRMSTIAAKQLADLGYTNLFQLDGGFDQWKSSGLPLEK